VRGAAGGEHALVLLDEPESVDLLVHDELGIADVLDLDPAHHLANDRLDVLVVDVDALETVDLLDPVEQVLLQLALTQDLEDLVRILRAVGERVSGADRSPSWTLTCSPFGTAYSRSSPSSVRMTILREPLTISP
jgi:hypothetical protein